MTVEPMTPMSDDGLALMRRTTEDALANGTEIRTSGAAWAVIIARLDAAERERDALREALQETADTIERVNLDERMCCSGQDCGCQGSTHRDFLLHNIRAALTANHSAPVVD